MYFAEEATTAASNFSGFDPFVIAFTALIIIGLIRLLRAPKKKNVFAIGFALVALATFGLMDVVMVLTWMGITL